MAVTTSKAAQSMPRRRMISRRAAAPAGSGSVEGRATLINVQRGEANTSQQLDYIDEFNQFPNGAGRTWVATPFDVPRLYEMLGVSNALRQCIDAYVTNTVGTGYDMEPLQRGKPQADGEASELQTFIENPNSEESMTALMKKIIFDREWAGFAFMEIIRDLSGEISLLRHAPSFFTRLGLTHEEQVLVEYTVQRGRRVSVIREYRRFRRYVQIVNGRMVWFKAFGDPRRVDSRTGAFEGEPDYRPGADATEIYHFKLPSVEPYGIPRWANQIPSILGSRESEEVNLNYFRDNTVPPMMLTVSGGRLTTASYRSINRVLQNADLGSRRQHKVMLIEAVGESDTLDGKGAPVKIEVEKLYDQRQQDALFQDYDKQNRAKIRSAWRLPPVVMGDATDQNYANAQISVFVAEAQVFGPDRDQIDEDLNRNIINGHAGLRLRSTRLKGRIASINSPDSLIKALTALNVIGSVTPREAQRIASQILQTEITPYPKPDEAGYADWMDKPLVLSRGNGGADTHADAQAKTDDIKSTEATGNAGFKQPEKGAEGAAL